jgi:hypothetical protein
MSAARQAAMMVLSGGLNLRDVTIRRIVDRLPASLVHQIVEESVVRNNANAGKETGGILPCPFCGGSADFDGSGNTVMCNECYATGAEHETPSIAAALWNRRLPVRVLAG